jgi:hypothetical protein
VHRNSTIWPLIAGRPKWMCACWTGDDRSRYDSVYAIVPSWLTVALKVPRPAELIVSGVSS